MTVARTLRAPAPFAGTGLFTGRPVRGSVQPAPAGAGLAFRRTDLPGAPPIRAHIDSLSPAPVHPAFERLPPRCTALRAGEASFATIEHILSALAGLGITDATVEIDSPELPIDDGSAAMFARAILAAGTIDMPGPIQPITLDRPISISDASGASITAEPSDAPRYTYHLDYGPASPIPPQSASWSGDPADYAGHIAPARTFCLEDEARAMQALGLFKNLSPRDLLVFGPRGPIDNTLRFPDEPARHKLLDLIGDLALAGRPIRARIAAIRSGHALNHQMARALAH